VSFFKRKPRCVHKWRVLERVDVPEAQNSVKAECVYPGDVERILRSRRAHTVVLVACDLCGAREREELR